MIVKVALAVPPSYLLDYSIKDTNVELFSRVLVQVGKRQLIGFIVAKDIKIDYELTRVKPILKIIDQPISDAVQRLILWLSQYYCCDLYNAIRLALPNDFLKIEKVSPQKDTYVYLDQIELQQHKLTSKQQEVLKIFANNEVLRFEDLKELASSYVINKLLDKNILKKTYKLRQFNITIESDLPKLLNSEQQYAFEQIASQSGFK
ncbi:primosomal protein N', partial [Francisella philomiragia]